MSKIVILDFTGAQVFVADYPNSSEGSENFTDGEDFIDFLSTEHDLGISSSNCQWLIIPEDKPLNITHL